MIFVTVGTQLPFDRLIEAIDTMAPRLGRPVFAQTSDSRYEPRNIEWKPFIRPLEVDRFFGEAEVIVAHAGIGTILTAQRLGKPVIVFPRRASLGEHRNEHQLATVSQLEGRRGIYVARDAETLEALLTGEPLVAPEPGGAGNPARERLAQHLDSIISGALAGTGR